MTALQWVAADARTGTVVADLPGLDLSGALKSTIGQYDTATASLPVAPGELAPPRNWLDATKPGGAALVALNTDGLPVWGGYITQRTRTTDDVVSLTLASAESYLDRRYVGDVTYAAIGQNSIVADLIARYVLDGAAGKPGVPMRVQYATAGVGAARDRAYLDTDDVRVYARMQQLASVLGGVEWSVGWEWQHSPERLTPVLYVGDRIGTAASAGLAPATTFSMPGCVVDADLVEDYSDGKGANDVTAVSSGQGTTRPTSGSIRAADYANRPTFEFRWTPSTSINDTATLQAHARQALAILGNGATALTLTAATQSAPMLGTAWQLGDDIGFELGGVALDGSELAPAFPGGMSGVGRAIGWQYDPKAETVSPILAVAELAQEAS